MQSNTREPDIRWLILGAVVGLIIAGTGILKKSSIDSYLPPNSIARVNDHFISNEAYLSAVNRYQGDSRNIMNDEKKTLLSKPPHTTMITTCNEFPPRYIL